MGGQYAAKTEVTSERSRSEIERILTRYGASRFAYGWDEAGAVIAFFAHDRNIRFVLPLPDRQDREFTHHSRGLRTSSAAQEAYEQAVRQKWRALVLVIKAKLESVASGIVTFETEFLAYTVLPSGRTVAEEITPAVDQAYLTGAVAPLQISRGPA